MLRKIGLWSFCAACFVGLCAFLPPSWNQEHAAEDGLNADALVIARVVGVELTGEERVLSETPQGTQVSEDVRTYCARLRVIRSYRGPLASGAVFTIAIGYDASVAGQEPYDFGGPLTLHQTQSGYDLQANRVYGLYLMRGSDGNSWAPRSGPYSIYRFDEDGVRQGELGGRWGEPADPASFIDRISSTAEADRE